MIDILQAEMLMQGGISNKYNASIVKMLLSNHGYVERTEVTNNINTVEFTNTVPRPERKFIEADE